MQKQTIEFAVVKKNGAVAQIGRSSIVQMKPNFKGDSTKWYPDKLKAKKE